jgi:hypothetical protein
MVFDRVLLALNSFAHVSSEIRAPATSERPVVYSNGFSWHPQHGSDFELSLALACWFTNGGTVTLMYRDGYEMTEFGPG